MQQVASHMREDVQKPHIAKFWNKKLLLYNMTVKIGLCTIYHPSRSKIRATGAEGNRSPNASIPASTTVTIDTTAAHVEITIAIPCFRPRVCSKGAKRLWCNYSRGLSMQQQLVQPCIKSNTLVDPVKHKFPDNETLLPLNQNISEPC